MMANAGWLYALGSREDAANNDGISKDSARPSNSNVHKDIIS